MALKSHMELDKEMAAAILYNYYSCVRAMTLVIMSHWVGQGGGHGTLYATVLTSSYILQVCYYKTITFLLANMYNFITSRN